MSVKITKTRERAIKDAQAFAAEGRVAAVITDGKGLKFAGVAGFIDNDMPDIKQVALVTPDGRIWTTNAKVSQDEASHSERHGL